MDICDKVSVWLAEMKAKNTGFCGFLLNFASYGVPEIIEMSIRVRSRLHGYVMFGI